MSIIPKILPTDLALSVVSPPFFALPHLLLFFNRTPHRLRRFLRLYVVYYLVAKRKVGPTMIQKRAQLTFPYVLGSAKW